MPVGALARAMPEREFVAWQQYAASRMLPGRRVELYLAQIALLIASANGASGKSLSDFMFDPPADEPEDDGDNFEAAVEFFGFKPRAKKKG